MLIVTVSAAALAYVPVCQPDLVEAGAAEFKEERRAEYRKDEPDLGRILELCACEIDAAWRDGSHTLDSVCEPIEVMFYICNERRPEWGCAEAALERFRAEGCAEDPDFRPIYFHLESEHRHRQMDLVGVTIALDRYVEALEEVSDPDTILQEHAIMAGKRIELAADLLNADVLAMELSTVEGLLSRLEPIRPEIAADVSNQIGWALLMARELEVAQADPSAWLERALVGYLGGARRNVSRADNTRINLALAALQTDDPEIAASWLEQIEAEESLSAEEQLWLDLTRVRLALMTGRPREALVWHEQLLARPDVEKVPLSGWFAAVSLGKILDFHEPARALEAYLAADALLESYVQQHRYGGSTDPRLMFFAEATRRSLELLARVDMEAAATFARRARNRAIRLAFGAFCDGPRAEDGLPRPAEGELRLLYSRLSRFDEVDGRTRWLGVAITAGRIDARELLVSEVPGNAAGQMAGEELSTQLLEPFRAHIEAASHIVFLPTEALHAVPFHELPWDRGPLIRAVPVSYGLDWAGCGAGVDSPGRRALVLAGTDAMAQLEPEATATATLLQESGYSQQLVTVARHADLQRIFSGNYAIAHFVTHGQRTARQLRGSDNLLDFSSPNSGADEPGRVTLSWRDVLGAPSVPPLVSLSACHSSFADTETLGGGINLTQAFLLRGSRFVMGATGDVDITIAAQFSLQFYSGLRGRNLEAIPELWREAYLTQRRATVSDLFPSLQMLRLYVH